MDDSGDDDGGYSLNLYEHSNHEQGYGSPQRQRPSFGSPPFSRPVSKESVDDYDEDDEEDEIELQEEEGGYDDDQMNGGQLVGKDVEDDDDDDEDDEKDEEDEDKRDDGKRKIYSNLNEDADMERHPKKRKLKSLVSNYEFVPRVPVPPAPAPASSVAKLSSGGRNSLTDWTERETFVLLDAWGERFLQRGKKSLRSEEWQEVAEKVSEISNIERTDIQCRNRLDTLKKKYKKEKMKFGDASDTASKWIYFKKMDMLLLSPPQQSGLSCGLDSGEYVFMNPKVYLNNANGFDELRDSPSDSESTDVEEYDSDGLPPKKRRSGRNTGDGSSFKLLADSIKNFGKIFENIENFRRQQIVELEKMRMDICRDLETQKSQIMGRAQAEIARLHDDDDKNDVSPKDASG